MAMTQGHPVIADDVKRNSGDVIPRINSGILIPGTLYLIDLGASALLAFIHGTIGAHRRAGHSASRHAARQPRQQVFFGDDDYLAYRTLLADSCRAAGVAVWAPFAAPSTIY